MSTGKIGRLYLPGQTPDAVCYLMGEADVDSLNSFYILQSCLEKKKQNRKEFPAETDSGL